MRYMHAASTQCNAISYGALRAAPYRMGMKDFPLLIPAVPHPPPNIPGFIAMLALPLDDRLRYGPRKLPPANFRANP